MARAWFTSWDAFSPSVIRDTRSSTRWSTGSDGFRYGRAVGDPAVCAAELSTIPNRTVTMGNINLRARRWFIEEENLSKYDCSDELSEQKRMKYSTVDVSCMARRIGQR